MPDGPAPTPCAIAALYCFAPVSDPAALRQTLRAQLSELGVKGTLLIAPEGINGTLAASPANLDLALDAIRAVPGFATLALRLSSASDAPFGKLKVRLKREIVTFHQPQVDPHKQVGAYVEPADWNALIASPGTVVIDVRNAFECAMGTFEGAIDPKTRSFSDFADWFRRERTRLGAQRYALFCTGGIRCEKATSFLLSEGERDVFHLKGGILNYLESIPETDSTWRGQCFVFDERVSVGHGLKPAKLGVGASAEEAPS
jgi:UPF0176 protein